MASKFSSQQVTVNLTFSVTLIATNLINSMLIFCHLGTEEKLAACKDLGADVCINYKTEDFVSRVKEETGGKG